MAPRKAKISKRREKKRRQKEQKEAKSRRRKAPDEEEDSGSLSSEGYQEFLEWKREEKKRKAQAKSNFLQRGIMPTVKSSTNMQTRSETPLKALHQNDFTSEIMRQRESETKPDILEEGTPRTQAQLARRIGRTRASVHSAVKVLRRRGILRQDILNLASHIHVETFRRSDRLTYQWHDGRRVQA